MYLGTSPSYDDVRAALDAHEIGLMCQPGSNRPQAGWIWAADSGCFSDAWEHSRWMTWLTSGLPRSGCIFATIPDVVGDHEATVYRWNCYADIVWGFHYPRAFVAQDGAESKSVPWHELDCLFIGGTTEWKQGNDALALASEARERGKWVHVGRVNSGERVRSWHGIAHSVDGTFLAFGPSQNLPRLLTWMEHANTQLLLQATKGIDET